MALNSLVIFETIIFLISLINSFSISILFIIEELSSSSSFGFSLIEFTTIFSSSSLSSFFMLLLSIIILGLVINDENLLELFFISNFLLKLK